MPLAHQIRGIGDWWLVIGDWGLVISDWDWWLVIENQLEFFGEFFFLQKFYHNWEFCFYIVPSMVYTLIRCIWLHDVGNQGSHHHVSRYMMYVDDGSMMDVDTSCMKSMDLYMMYPHPSWIHRRDTSCNQIHRIRVYTIDGFGFQQVLQSISEELGIRI